MVMSQGTYTFLACFAGFWLIWALVVMLCCFCSFLQRRLKRRHEERLREQCLRTVEMEPLSCPPAPSVPPPLPPPAPPQLPREPPLFCPPPPPPPPPPAPRRSPPVPLPVPHPMPQATWVSLPGNVEDSETFGKPPCYEEAVLMEDPPPPYSEVLADPRGGTYVKPRALRHPLPQRERQDAAPAKPPMMMLFPERGYSSLIRLPSSQRWDSLGHLLSNMDLNHNLTPPVGSAGAAAVATMPRREPRAPLNALRGLQGGIAGLPGRRQGAQEGFQAGLQSLRVLEPSCGLPTAFPLLGRSTAV